MRLNRPFGLLALSGISALASVANATQPPCATSDATNSTACGSSALSFNAGQYNTAIGVIALEGNNTGANNTAAGAWALNQNVTGNNNTATRLIARGDGSK